MLQKQEDTGRGHDDLSLYLNLVQSTKEVLAKYKFSILNGNGKEVELQGTCHDIWVYIMQDFYIIVNWSKMYTILHTFL